MCNEDAQQEIFNQLAKFSSDAIKAQQEFSARLGAAHSKALEEWNKSIDLFRSRYYSEAGNDIRKSLEFLLRDILKNGTSIEQQVKGSGKELLKSNLGKYLSSKEINKINITFLINIITPITHISNEKFKHGYANLPLAWYADYLSIYRFSELGGIASDSRCLVYCRPVVPFAIVEFVKLNVIGKRKMLNSEVKSGLCHFFGFRYAVR